MDATSQLRDILNYLNINAKVFSEKLGYERPQIMYDIQKGKTKRLSTDLVNKISSVFPELSRVWLLTGEGEMLRGEVKAQEGFCMVPLLPVEAFAGPIDSYLSGAVTAAQCARAVSPVAGAELAIPVSGRSMEPLFMDGSLLYVARIDGSAFIPWGAPLVVDTDNGTLVKRLYPAEGRDDMVEARSVNPDYPPFLVPKASVRALYRILASAKFHPTL